RAETMLGAPGPFGLSRKVSIKLVAASLSSLIRISRNSAAMRVSADGSISLIVQTLCNESRPETRRRRLPPAPTRFQTPRAGRRTARRRLHTGAPRPWRPQAPAPAALATGPYRLDLGREASAKAGRVDPATRAGQEQPHRRARPVCVAGRGPRAPRSWWSPLMNARPASSIGWPRGWWSSTRSWRPVSSSTPPVDRAGGGFVVSGLPAVPKRLEGQDFTLAIVDEAGRVDQEVYEVVALVTGKQQASVVLAIGTPGPELEQTVLGRLRTYATDHPEDPLVVWREHSAAGFEDHPVDCRHCWELANPAGGDFLAWDGLEACLPPKMREASFRRARLCRLTDQLEEAWLPPGNWASVAD